MQSLLLCYCWGNKIMVVNIILVYIASVFECSGEDLLSELGVMMVPKFPVRKEIDCKPAVGHSSGAVRLIEPL